MKTYGLYVNETVSTYVEYEAESLADAVEQFYEDGLPSLIFVDHRYPDESEWQVDLDAAREDYPDEEVEDDYR